MNCSPIKTTPVARVKELIDLLVDLGIDALHLRVDAKRVGDTLPDVSLWVTYRTEFERVCQALGLEATERRFAPVGQRQWFAERDTDGLRLLVQTVSFEHHDDWQPRPTPASSP